jgi:hemoglobin-like flavoprotein
MNSSGRRDDLVRVFNDSYERVLHPDRADEFFGAFYRQLMTSSDEAAAKFHNTDMKKQVRMLQASVRILLAVYATGAEPAEFLSNLAERHSKNGVDISPAMYAVWLDCLIKTVQQFDARFDADVEAAWRVVFSKGIAFMISKYESN